jgi:hypothetical protein
MSTPAAYPLHWPPGWQKTEPQKRESGRFKCTLSSALNSLTGEIGRLGGTGLVLSSNVTLGNENPKDTGVVAYFVHEGVQVAIPCDRWKTVPHNVRAIALTIEAMRGMERWGAKNMIRAMFTGFKALPSSGARHWTDVMGFKDGQVISEEDASRRYKQLAQERHPDKGGNAELMTALNVAWDEAKRERGWA